MGQGLFRSGWLDGPGMEKKISRRNVGGEDGGRGGEEMETRSVLGGSGTTDTTRVGGWRVWWNTFISKMGNLRTSNN